MATKQEIINVIADHVSKRGGNYSEWYVGIATDPGERLFDDHSVDEKNGHWIHHPCVSSDDAREIEDYFIAKGMKGGPGGGDSGTKAVYAYKITNSTRE